MSPHSQGVNQQSHEMTRGRSSSGHDRTQETLDHSTDVERAQAARTACSAGRYKEAHNAMREKGRSKTGIASHLHVKLAPMSAPGPSGERQEYLDAITAFVSAGQRRRLFRIPDILTVKWATGDLPEECRFLRKTQPVFLKSEKDSTTKMFDDGGWISCLTEAQAATGDIPEERITHDPSEVDPSEARPIQMGGEFVRKYVPRLLLTLSEGDIAALTTAMRQLGVGSQGGAEGLAIFHQLIFDDWTSGTLGTLLARIKVDETNWFRNV